MKTRYKVILAIVVTIVLLVVGNLFLRFTLPPVVVRAEQLPGVIIAGVHVSNALVTALLVDIILVILYCNRLLSVYIIM